MSQDLSDFSYHTPITPELFAEQMTVKEKLYDFNALRPSDHESQAALLNDLLGSHNGAHIVAPFYCDMGKIFTSNWAAFLTPE